MKYVLYGNTSPYAMGFSLIEVLVALLILSFGLLGFALLQTMGVRFSQGSNNRTEATNLAYALLDDARAHRADKENYPTYASFAKGSVPYSRTVGCNPLTGQQAASVSTAIWKCQVVGTLGADSSASVTYNNGIINIILQWPERTGEDATSFQVSSAL